MKTHCTTNRSRVPWRSSEGIKGGVTTVGSRERTRPGILVCVCCRQSSVRGCALFIDLFNLLLKC